MRSLPFICLADTLSIFSKVGYRRLRFGTSLGKSVRNVIDERFGSHEEVLEFVRTSWLRWLFFCLGPMPQAIRLASFEGTFWTQFFGFSYLLSWVLIETLGVISARTVTQNVAITDQINFEFLDGFYYFLALLCYYSSLLYFLLVFMLSRVRRKFQERESQEWNLEHWMLLVGMFNFGVLLLWIRNYIVRSFLIFCHKYKFFGQCLLVNFQEGESKTLEVDIDAGLWLVWFVGNLLVCLIGYCFLYDSSETVNPRWTAVFG